MSEPTDLIPWLLAQIAEDDRRARAADRNPLLDLIILPRRWGKRSMAEHINAWLPQRARAECDSKRRIIQLHAVRSGTGGDWNTDPPALCNEDSDLYPCPTLCLLAEPYAGRPGYREEWQRWTT